VDAYSRHKYTPAGFVAHLGRRHGIYYDGESKNAAKDRGRNGAIFTTFVIHVEEEEEEEKASAGPASFMRPRRNPRKRPKR
jgi:hypothetical protein